MILIKFVIIFSLALGFTIPALGNQLFVGGQAYKLSPVGLKDCVTTEQKQEMLSNAGDVAWVVKIETAVASCRIMCRVKGKVESECSDFCEKDPDQVKRNKKDAVDSILSEVRSYPSAFKHQFCKEGRQACEDRCNSSEVYDPQYCMVGCNQYESYNQ